VTTKPITSSISLTTVASVPNIATLYDSGEDKHAEKIVITAGIATMFSRFLDTNGDGSGTKNANGNYAGGEEIFYIQPGGTDIINVARLVVQIEDGGKFGSGKYGALAGALANGIAVRVQDDSGTVIDLTDGVLITTNVHWARYCYDVDHSDFGTGNEYMDVRWTFSKSGNPIVLDAANNERLEVVLNDNLSGLVGHYFLVQGTFR